MEKDVLSQRYQDPNAVGNESADATGRTSQGKRKGNPSKQSAKPPPRHGNTGTYSGRHQVF